MRSTVRLLLLTLVAVGLLVLLTGTMSLAIPTNDPPVIDDFESGLPGTWFQYGDYGSGTFINTAVVATSTVPGLDPNNVLEIQYNSAGWGAGTGNALGGQDWSAYEGFGFWFKGAATGATYRVILSDNPNPSVPGDSAERFAYEFVDNSTAWRHILIPWGAFFRDYAWQPPGAPNDGLTLTQVQAYALALPSGTNATVYVDEVRLVQFRRVDDFESGLPGTWFQYGDYGSGTFINTAVVATSTVPGLDPNNVLEIQYNSAGWGAGTGNALGGQDWSDHNGMGFWFWGGNSGGTYRVILSDNPNPSVPGDSAERFAYEFVDNFNGWRFISVPWGAFFRDYAWQPPGAPNDGLTLTEVQAYALALPGGSRTTYLDQVVLFGDGAVTLSVGFAQSSYTVQEGQAITLTVALNAPATAQVTVDVTTTGGTATAGADYQAVNATLTFPAGTTEQTVVLQTVDDGDQEGDETVILTLSNPVGAQLGARNQATVTIGANDAPRLSGKSVLIDDFERADLPSGQDPNSIGVGYVTWNHPAASAAITLTATPPAAVPGAPDPNTVLQLNLTIGTSQWAGYTHAFTNPAADEWRSQDWSRYVGVSFWLYGNNTGGTLFFDILDNRNPGSTRDDAERWSVDIPDNFTGWRFFQFAWDDFRRKEIGNGAPNDGLGLTEVHGYAIGGYGSVNMGSQSYFVDDVGLIMRTTVVDDFERADLPSGQDPNSIGVGYVTWSHPAASAAITLTATPPAAVPGAPDPNTVLQLNLTIGTSQWAGYTHAFTNPAADEWRSQDWSSYEGVYFWLYGNNTGGTLFFDILDNRNPGSTRDDAERWSVDIPDNFTGWRFFQFAWDNFRRKEIGNGAPNDGLTLTQVWGYAVGGYGSVNMGSQSYFVDDVILYGNVSGGETGLQIAFASTVYRVREGESVAVTVTLSSPYTDTVTVDYRSAESVAKPDRDYVPVSGTLTFTPGQTAAIFSVQTFDNSKRDGNRALMLNLSNPVNAELAFARRAMVTIVDNDPVDAGLIDDFEGWHPFQSTGAVTLTAPFLLAGDPNARPGQDRYEGVVQAVFDTTAGPASFHRTFARPEDWSNYDGISFWYYGSGSRRAVKVTLLDNQTATTGSVPPANWELIWSDEFNDPTGTPPNPNKWTHEIGDGTMYGIPGWGNGEFQFYTDDPVNARTDGAGNLVISLRSTGDDSRLCWYGPCQYTSARLVSARKNEFQYGRIEARIQVPDGPAGLWPAFWMLGTNIGEVGWPQSGEIDIMEYVSRLPDEIFGTIHGPGYSGGASFGNTYRFPGPVATDYHTFAVEWGPDKIHWYVDGINYHNATPADVAPNQWVFNQPFFLILNMAIGGNLGGAIDPRMTFPQDLKVDYVRVYGAADTAERFEASFTDNFTGWRKVILPFRSFTRSAQQPAAAPNDGLTLSEVWGYGFTLPQGASGTFRLDQVRLADLWIRFMPIIARQ